LNLSILCDECNQTAEVVDLHQCNQSTCTLTETCRKYPQFQQDEIFSLQDAFRKLDVDDKGYIDEATAIKATQASERQPYDVVRQALKEVELDSSRRVELDDFVGVRYLK
jgi:hypothetical protein